MSREAKILGAILVIVIGAMIALFATNNKASVSTGQKADASKLVRESSQKTGSGPVTLVEFGDYQCPSCGVAHPIIKDLQKEYSGKLVFVFRNFPLTSIHQNAMASSLAAEAAGKQGKFWEMHNKIYETQKDWENDAAAADRFAAYAGELGLNVDTYKQDVASEAVKKIVQDDMADGTALNVQGTPTFYVNGQQAVDFQRDTLKKLIDDELAK